ncbi:UNVERIFIED_CONTAM: Ankyrin repeat domain-containing protein, chloroplastic [Sesamum angustifolium]|uniref:Ankyrin repeat domain-containing protein, chloroplastic n=1 Tax=Sesamum angustifolium TaxID=2727405 RepID=A0AAW2RKD6_9LAMI
MSSSAPPPSTILRRTHTPIIFSLLPTFSLSLPAPSHLDFHRLTPANCKVLQVPHFSSPLSDEAQLSKPDNTKDKGTAISPENLIPEDWMHVQRELNITKKERRKLSQQLEYGRRVEKRRQALMPLNSGEYEKFKNEKLQKLKPIVLDDPEPKYLDENDKHEKDDDERNGEELE